MSTKNKVTYQVIEDNGGGLFLFFFDGDKLILGVENLECCQPGDLDTITLDDALTWDGQLSEPAIYYDGITSYEFGWSIVADNEGVYPDRMDRAAQLVFGVDGIR